MERNMVLVRLREVTVLMLQSTLLIFSDGRPKTISPQQLFWGWIFKPGNPLSSHFLEWLSIGWPRGYQWRQMTMPRWKADGHCHMVNKSRNQNCARSGLPTLFISVFILFYLFIFGFKVYKLTVDILAIVELACDRNPEKNLDHMEEMRARQRLLPHKKQLLSSQDACVPVSV